jgi:hypothetical protein
MAALKSCVARRSPYCIATVTRQRRSHHESARDEWRKDAAMISAFPSVKFPARQYTRRQFAAALSFATASCY